MSNSGNYAKSVLRSCTSYLVGILVFLGIFIYVVLNVPVFLYRLLICKVIAPHYRKDLGEAISVNGALMASEFSGNGSKLPSRYSVVTNTIYTGSLSFQEFQEIVTKNWITAENSEGPGLRYPEFQQCITHWMGYFFWKTDPDFDLDNHVKHHKCNEDWSEEECEKFVCSLIEDLLNQQFPSNRSPWEAHLVSNFRNSGAVPGGKVSSVLVFRFHHAIADGFAMFSAVLEGLLEIPLSKCLMATPSKAKQPDAHQDWKFLSKIAKFSMFPLNALRDVGYAMSRTTLTTNTPWIIPDKDKSWRQIYCRSGLLPISKFRRVKEAFGVSFTAILLSCTSAAIVSSLKSKKFQNNIRCLPLIAASPLPGHPLKLKNHATMALFELPTDQNLSSVERLKKSEKYFQKGKQSTFPYFLWYGIQIFATQIAPVLKHIFRNRRVSTYMTNFPGPSVNMRYRDGEFTTQDFVAGGMDGVAGLGFCIISHHDHIRIVTVAENACMTRRELTNLNNAFCDELEYLDELAGKLVVT